MTPPSEPQAARAGATAGPDMASVRLPAVDPYRRLVQEAGHLLWIVTAEGLADVEQSWCPYTGQAPADTAGWGWLAAVHPDDRARVRREWAGVVATGDHYESIYRLRRADGTYHTFRVLGLPILPADGQSRWAAFGTDVTVSARTEAALRSSEEARLTYEERLRAVAANAPIILFAMNKDGIFTHSQGRGLELLGLAPGEHVGQSYFDLYGHLPESAAALQRVLAGEEATTIERYRGLTFETRWMPTRADDGTVTGVIGVSADITAWALTEEERRKMLEREQQARVQAAQRSATLAATFDAITDGILVYDMDGRLVHGNAAAHIANAWAAQPGYEDKSFDERVAQALPRDADGRLLAREEWPISRVLRGEILRGEEVVDTVVRRPDGQDVILSVSGAPIRDTAGHIVGGVIVDRDVTAQRRLQRRTREALEALLEMAQALVLPPQEDEAVDQRLDRAASRVQGIGQRLVTLTHRVLGCRRISMVAIEPQTGIQEPLAAVGLTPEEERMWRGATAGVSLFARGDPLTTSIVARVRSGEIFVLDMTQPPLNENPYGVRSLLVAPMRIGDDLVGIYSLDYGDEDHTYTADELALAAGVARLAALTIERERLLREREAAGARALALAEANRRMDEFLGVASHELRTPVTSLRASLQILQRRLERASFDGMDDRVSAAAVLPPSRLSPLLDRALHQSGVLAGLVNDLLDLSRIQAGQLQLQRVPCNLVVLVMRTAAERRLLHPTRTILTETSPDSAVVDGDPERLSQVVDHYLDNALKYSTEAQPVTVGVVLDGMTARVWVRDLGPGVPPSEQDRIWERFYRAVGTERRSGSSVGLGLSLYISRTIIERHGGRVGLTSLPGIGTTFWFDLPLATEARRGEAVSDAAR